MTAPAWRCRPLFTTVKSRSAPRVHHPRRLHRVAHAAISKPAIVGWLCVAVTGWPAPLGQPAIASIPSASPTITADSSPWDVLPCCAVDVPPPTIEIPIIGPPVLLPDVPLVPPTPPTRVPEPRSLAMLATALVAWAITRGRF